MEQALDKPDLLAQVTQGLKLEEKHLVYLELMIMEQVADWEIGTGRMEQESGWDKPKRLVVTLPNGTTKTIGISQGTQKRYWFGICPVSSKIGNLKMCGGCKMIGYVGKEEQVDKIRFMLRILLLFFFSKSRQNCPNSAKCKQILNCRERIGLVTNLCARYSKVFVSRI